MSITYPTTLDAITAPTPGLPLGQAQGGRTQTGYVADMIAMAQALEAKVGVDQSAATASHEYRLRGAPHTRATQAVAADTTSAQTVDTSANKVRSDCTGSVRAFAGGFAVSPSRITVNGARTQISVAAETIDGVAQEFLAGDDLIVEYAGEGA